MRGKGWLLPAAVLLMFGIVLGLRLYQRHERAQEAERFYAAGNYEAAKALYTALGDKAGIARSDAALRDTLYQGAERLLAAGDFAGAEELLLKLGDYRDSALLLQNCAFLRAQALAEAGEPEKAWAVYITIEDYPGAAEAMDALRPALYDRAMELAYGTEIAQACELWRTLGNYKNSPRLLTRGERILARMNDETRTRLNDPAKRYDTPLYPEAYVSSKAYILFPETPNADTRFFLYLPGGRNEELYVDFLYYYLENPAPNTLAVFMRRNGLPNMESGCIEALSLLEQAAADCGLFVHDVLVAGSSLGAYPALQCPRVAWRDFGITVPCVLSLDAGNGWSESQLIPSVSQCRELAELGTQLYLFQPTWEDTSYDPIRNLVEAGCWVMLAGCLRDDHEQITCDALGMGVIDWALGDREKPCPADIYSFRRLRQSDL